MAGSGEENSLSDPRAPSVACGALTRLSPEFLQDLAFVLRSRGGYFDAGLRGGRQRVSMVWFVLAGLTAVAVLAAIWPLLRPSDSTDRDAASSEAAFYRAQLDEIQRDVERGQLPESEAAGARAEAARRLLAAGSPNGIASSVFMPLRLALPMT